MTSDLGALTYEQALDELETIIRKLEKGEVDLNESMACYERGSQLAEHCAALLDRTEQRITALVERGGRKEEDAFTPPKVDDGTNGDRSSDADTIPF